MIPTHTYLASIRGELIEIMYECLYVCMYVCLFARTAVLDGEVLLTRLSLSVCLSAACLSARELERRGTNCFCKEILYVWMAL